jgi:hypothetical protein
MFYGGCKPNVLLLEKVDCIEAAFGRRYYQNEDQKHLASKNFKLPSIPTDFFVNQLLDAIVTL